MKGFEVLFRELSYEQALEAQLSRAARGDAFGVLLFRCSPTITLGKRADLNDVLCPDAQLEKLGVRKIAVDRGGLVTFHGPGQLVGFPFGKLEDFVGNPRGVRAFVAKLKEALEDFISSELERERDPRGVDRSTPDDQAGVWLREPESGARAKIVSIGLGFGAAGVRHGFSLNVAWRGPGFELIHPCGERTGEGQAYLFSPGREPVASDEDYRGVVLRLSGALARGFGRGARFDK